MGERQQGDAILKNLIILIFLACLLAACGAEAVQTPARDDFTPTAAVTLPETENAAETITATPSPTPTLRPDPVGWDAERNQNLIPPPGDDRAVLEAYYRPSKATSYGYLTRYLEHRRALEVAVWQVHHFQEQINRMEVLLGGGYSPDTRRDGEGEVPNGIGFDLWGDGPVKINPGSIIELTPAQVRLYGLVQIYNEAIAHGFTPEQADQEVRQFLINGYDSIVAMKSPNDIGRVFCVYRSYVPEMPLVARVIVMDTSAVNDFTGIGGTAGVPLGYRVTPDPTGRETHWLADVPHDLFDQLTFGDNAWALFIEDVDNRGCPFNAQ